MAATQQDITQQLQGLAASGDYKQLFAVASKYGDLVDLTTAAGWTALGLKDPSSASQFASLYQAFQPYEAKLQGKRAVGASGYQGASPGSTNVTWGDPGNWSSDALANWQAAQKAGSVSSNEAMLGAANKQIAASPTLQWMTEHGGAGPHGGGGGPGERALQNLQTDAPNLATFMGSDQTALAANRASNIGIGEVVGLAAAGFGGAIAAGAAAGAPAAEAAPAASAAAPGYDAAGVASDLSTVPSAANADFLASTSLPDATAPVGSSITDVAPIAAPDPTLASAPIDMSASTSLPTIPETSGGYGFANPNWTNIGTRAALGAGQSAARGGNPVVGAAEGAIGSYVGGGVVGAGAPSVVGSVAGNVASTAAGKVLSPSGGTMPQANTPTLNFNPTQPTVPGGVSPDLSGGMNAGFGATGTQGMTPSGTPTGTPTDTSGGLGTDLGTLATDLASNPLVQFGLPLGVGMNAAKRANQQNQGYANKLISAGQPELTAGQNLLNQFKAGQLTPQESAVVNTLTTWGKSLTTDPTTTALKNIAMTAFSNYNNQKLTPADQASLAQAIAQAQATGSQALGAQNWSSTAPQVNFQISQMAAQYKQNLLTAQFQTGETAYNQWLSTTTEGQNAIVAGQQYAVQSLSDMLNQSLNLTAQGMGPIQDAINLEIASNIYTSQQVQQLLTGLTTAYARAQYGTQGQTPSAGTGSSIAGAAGKVGGDLASLFGGGGGGGGGGGPVTDPNFGSAPDPTSAAGSGTNPWTGDTTGDGGNFFGDLGL